MMYWNYAKFQSKKSHLDLSFISNLSNWHIAQVYYQKWHISLILVTCLVSENSHPLSIVKKILPEYKPPHATLPTDGIFGVMISELNIRMFCFMVLCSIKNLYLITLFSFSFLILLSITLFKSHQDYTKFQSHKSHFDLSFHFCRSNWHFAQVQSIDSIFCRITGIHQPRGVFNRLIYCCFYNGILLLCCIFLQLQMLLVVIDNINCTNPIPTDHYKF